MVVIAGRPQQAMHAGGDDCEPPSGAFSTSPYLCFYTVVPGRVHVVICPDTYQLYQRLSLSYP